MRMVKGVRAICTQIFLWVTSRKEESHRISSFPTLCVKPVYGR